MAFLSRNSVLAAEDFEYAIVPCPEWGGDMRVRGLTAAENSLIARKSQEKKTDDLSVVICIMGCVDENGERFFNNNDKEELKKRSYAVIERLSTKILELSGDTYANAIEEKRKNSSKTAGDDSL